MSSGLPEAIRIREVGPRDGFQNEPETIATADKIRLINSLARTGIKRLEVTSFVRADVIPQLSDAEAVLDGIDVPDDVAVSVLIPNLKGLERALERRDRFTGLRCEAVISTSFGCPYEGYVAPELVLSLAARLADAGAQEIGFGDSTGMANPLQVSNFFALAQEALPGLELTAHFHNTRGQGLANVLSALEVGIDSFESSFGELGGCPVPAGATGNIATEDLVSMVEEMGVDTGIDLTALLAAVADVREVLGRQLGSHTLVAGPIDWRAGAN